MTNENGTRNLICLHWSIVFSDTCFNITLIARISVVNANMTNSGFTISACFSVGVLSDIRTLTWPYGHWILHAGRNRAIFVIWVYVVTGSHFGIRRVVIKNYDGIYKSFKWCIILLRMLPVSRSQTKVGILIIRKCKNWKFIIPLNSIY